MNPQTLRQAFARNGKPVTITTLSGEYERHPKYNYYQRYFEKEFSLYCIAKPEPEKKQDQNFKQRLKRQRSTRGSQAQEGARPRTLQKASSRGYKGNGALEGASQAQDPTEGFTQTL